MRSTAHPRAPRNNDRTTAWRSRALVVAMVLGTAGLVGLWVPDRAAASCAGPQVWVAVGGATPTLVTESAPALVVRRGDRLVVRGELFHTGCEDTSSTGPGCSGPPPSDRERPMADVALTLQQGASAWPLGSTAAGPRAERYPVAFDVVVPDSVAPGAATLRVGSVDVPLAVQV